jgi:hypothetical protein
VSLSASATLIVLMETWMAEGRSAPSTPSAPNTTLSTAASVTSMVMTTSPCAASAGVVTHDAAFGGQRLGLGGAAVIDTERETGFEQIVGHGIPMAPS